MKAVTPMAQMSVCGTAPWPSRSSGAAEEHRWISTDGRAQMRDTDVWVHIRGTGGWAQLGGLGEWVQVGDTSGGGPSERLVNINAAGRGGQEWQEGALLPATTDEVPHTHPWFPSSP